MIWRRIILQGGSGRRKKDMWEGNGEGVEGLEGLKKVEIENDWIRDWAWEREV